MPKIEDRDGQRRDESGQRGQWARHSSRPSATSSRTMGNAAAAVLSQATGERIVDLNPGRRRHNVRTPSSVELRVIMAGQPLPVSSTSRICGRPPSDGCRAPSSTTSTAAPMREITLRENSRAFDEIAFRPRCAVATPEARPAHDGARHGDRRCR